MPEQVSGEATLEQEAYGRWRMGHDEEFTGTLIEDPHEAIRQAFRAGWYASRDFNPSPLPMPPGHVKRWEIVVGCVIFLIVVSAVVYVASMWWCR